MVLRISLVVLTLSLSPARAQWSLERRNTVNLGDTAMDQHGQPFTVTGLSGITYAGGTTWLCAMDNSDKVVVLDVSLAPDGTMSAASIAGGLSLDQAKDFEGLAFAGAAPGSVYLAEEGTPAVHQHSLADGALLQTLVTPAVFASLRPNLGFESLTRRCPGAELWTANEEALTVDGPRATPTHGTTVRLLRYDETTNPPTPAEQFAYEVERMHGNYLPGPSGQSGLSDLAVLHDGTLLALERSLALAAPLFLSRIYEVDLAGATDVSGLPSLDGSSYVPVAKKLLWSGGASNLEGLGLGPRLASGHRALLGIVDDGDPLSQNQVVAFELIGPPLADALGGATCP